METVRKTILYVDDDEDDREFLRDAFREVDPSVDLIIAEDGRQALDYLNAVETEPSHRPCLIVLDINMPYLDGKQTLQRIRARSELKKVPIVVFTSSDNPNDKSLFHSQGVEMITKPDNLDYLNMVASHMVQVCREEG